MGLGSGSSGLNQLLSKFGYTRLPKSNEHQPLISQNYHHYQFQTLEDEAAENNVISSLEKKLACLEDEIRRINSGIYNLESAMFSTSWIDVVNLSVKPIKEELAKLSARVAKLEKDPTTKSVDVANSSINPIKKELSELKAKVVKLEKTHSLTPKALVQVTQKNNAVSEKKLEDLTTSIQIMLKSESAMLKKQEAIIQKLQTKNAALEKKLEDLTTSVQLLKSNMPVPNLLGTHANSPSSTMTMGSGVEWHYPDSFKLLNNRVEDLDVASFLIVFLVSIIIGFCFA